MKYRYVASQEIGKNKNLSKKIAFLEAMQEIAEEIGNGHEANCINLEVNFYEDTEKSISFCAIDIDKYSYYE